MFEYEYPHPAVTTDAAVFTVRDGRLEILLIRRGREPFRGRWALPGGFVDIDEELHDCVARELEEEAGVSGLPLQQLMTVGTVGRDPRERVITVVYWCLAPADELAPKGGDDADEAAWFEAATLPPLASDHNDIIAAALARLDTEIFTSPLLSRLLPDEFDGTELHRLCEAVLRRPCAPSMPTDRLLAMGVIEPVAPADPDAAPRFRFSPTV